MTGTTMMSDATDGASSSTMSSNSRPLLAAISVREVGGSTAKLGRQVGEGAQVIIDDGLARDADDAAIGGELVGFFAFANGANGELAMLVNLFERGRITKSGALTPACRSAIASSASATHKPVAPLSSAVVAHCSAPCP